MSLSMHRFLPAFILLFGPCVPLALPAAEILRLDVAQQGPDYTIEMEAQLPVPMAAAWRVLTDYPQLQTLSPSVRESEVLDQVGPQAQRVRLLSRLCVYIFCKDIKQTQIMHRLAFGDLRAEIEPVASDFESGQARWRLEDIQGATHLHFETNLRPAFWVPPLVGPWAVKHALRREAQLIVEGLERRARGKP